jgi:putative N-acetyltransferase (TIGR04045 family)
MVFLDPSSSDSDGSGMGFSSAPAAFTPSVRWCTGIDESDFRLSPTASSPRFSFHLLRDRSALLEGYWDLRRVIFCEEQGLFDDSDRDAIDAHAYPIAALNHGGHPEPGGVVGVVRIYEDVPRIWYGGRLGVHAAFRRHNQIGKGLIWKAVTTANAWGCDRFLATVQLPNVRFFQRLHWRSLESLEIRGVAHHLMEADLEYYIPCWERRPERRVA